MGKVEKIKELIVAVNEFIAVLKSDQLKQRIKEATLHSTLKILSKYFVNFKYDDFKKLTNGSEKEVIQLGYAIRDGYIETKK